MAVVSSIGVIVRYHLGTLALGSLVITILGLVKAAVEKFQHKARKMNSSSCMKTLLRYVYQRTREVLLLSISMA